MQQVDIRKSLHKALTENLLLKLMSLAIAFVLWLVVSGEKDTEWAYLIPLEVKNLPKNLIVTNNIPEFLDVRMKGPRSFMMEINPQEMKVELNVVDLRLGSNIYPITPGHIRTPRGVGITRINPSYLTVETDKLFSKKIEIKAEIKGKPAEGYVLDSIEVIPSTMHLSGAVGEVGKLKFLKTGTVDISGARGNVKQAVPVDKGGRALVLSKEEPVSVLVRIEEKTKKVEVRGVEIKILNNPGKARVNPSQVDLYVEGPGSVIEMLGSKKLITAAVDAGRFSAGKHNVEAKFNLPAKIKVLFSNPKRVVLTIP